MSGRLLNCFVIIGLVVLLGVLPVSSAQAAPADRSARNLLEGQLQDLSRAFIQVLQELWTRLPEFQGDAPPGNSDPNNPPGPPPSSEGRDGVGIDPNGRRGN